MINRSMAAGTAAVFLAAGSAFAVPELQFDMNSLVGQSSGAFSTNFTGSLVVSNDMTAFGESGRNANSVLERVLVDGVAQAGTQRATNDFRFVMTINFVGGSISGGNLSLALPGDNNTYSAQIANAAGQSILGTGVGGLITTFTILGVTFDGAFTDPSGTMAGVDISPWGAVQPLPGYFNQFTFNPDANGRDNSTDVDLFVLIPLPSAGGMGLAGMGLLGASALRRRRA